MKEITLQDGTKIILTPEAEQNLLSQLQEQQKPVWKRENINSEGLEYNAIDRCVYNGFKTIVHGNGKYANLNYTFETKQEAEEEALLHSIMMLMRNWAKFHNKLDGFVPDFGNSIQDKYGLRFSNEIECYPHPFQTINPFIFQISVSSKQRAEQMLNEFKEDLEKIKHLLR